MRQSKFYVFSVMAVLTVVLLLSAGPADPASPASPQWEYGTYEIIERTTGRVQRTFSWQTQKDSVSAPEDKFRLFVKLGIRCTRGTAHELMLWNHVGKEGWEFVTYQSDSTLEADRTMTIFRRLRK